MELRLQPELAAKVEQWSAQTGRPAGEVVEEAIAGYFAEIESVQKTLDSRYDDIVNGRVEPVDGEEAVRLIKDRAAARRNSMA
jgi:predicted transcriptional regulator